VGFFPLRISPKKTATLRSPPLSHTMLGLDLLHRHPLSLWTIDRVSSSNKFPCHFRMVTLDGFPWNIDLLISWIVVSRTPLISHLVKFYNMGVQSFPLLTPQSPAFLFRSHIVFVERCGSSLNPFVGGWFNYMFSLPHPGILPESNCGGLWLQVFVVDLWPEREPKRTELAIQSRGPCLNHDNFF